MWIRSVLFALALFGLAASGAQAADACRLVRYAELPVTMVGLRPVIAARINGHAVFFVIDSGAFYSLISPEAASRLGLKLYPLPPRVNIIGVGGRMDARITTVKEFDVGLVSVPNVDFLSGAGPLFEGDIIGAVGQNFLRQYDVEYDLANGVIRLFKPDRGCADAARVYWSKSWSVVTIDEPTELEPHLIAGVTVNGRKLRATFDTGASFSMLSLKGAARLGLTPRSPGVAAAGVTWGGGPRQMDVWAAPIESVALGDETVKNTRLQMAGIDLNGQSDLLLGADFFLAHRIYVATGQRRLYFTYNGGGVFNLNTPSQMAVVVGDAPTAADGLVRRAAAFLARRDYVHAIGDLTAAIGLEPTVATHFHDRAMAYQANHQPALALADLGEALRLKPGDAASLVLRGGLYLEAHDEARAGADFDAALARPDVDPGARLVIAADYAGARLYEPAIVHFDRWIADNPKSGQRADALNGRCRTRAEWGRELDRALADCEAALKLRPRVAAYLDSRGLVRLRAGQIDAAIADYDEALKTQPKLAWSLYARGLAERRKGLKAEGDADVAAGAALDAALPADAAGIGLTETEAAAPAPARPAA